MRFDHRSRSHDHTDGDVHRGGAARAAAYLKHALLPHAHSTHDTVRTADETSRDGMRAAWVGLAGMAATALAQIVIVAVSGSIALWADTVHNIGHAVTTIPLIIAFALGRRRPTEVYPYGRRRVEDLVGLFIGLIVLASAGWIIYESIRGLAEPRELTNLGWVFAAGVVGFLGNEAVAVYRIRAGRRIGSAALVAEGQHARADGLTSIAVVVGVLGVWAGFPRTDAVVGLLIGLSIIGILVASMRPVVRRLMDGIEPESLARTRAIALQVDGVVGVDRVRLRWTGHRMVGDASIRVPATLTVVQAHEVTEQVEHALLHGIQHLESVVVHVHPDVTGEDEAALHSLTAHHASAEARAAFAMAGERPDRR